ncbi:MAG: aromatic ring-hydroxylating dioxygenase subunit alpha [Myxococcales bacterium]|nr:aromatic ring-hydroxylating dioxygenase subunit alpha [Myxococcales bacterium]
MSGPPLMTLPALSLYGEANWSRLVERVLARSWHVVASLDELAEGRLMARTLLPGVLDEPLLLGLVDGQVRGWSGVCTHRAAILEPHGEGARCPYHGRRFTHAGRCVSAPGFERPGPQDHLRPVSIATLGPLIFAAVDPAMPFASLFPEETLAWLPRLPAPPDPLGETSFEVEAHFLLYVENYLEGLHVPFVHPGLTAALDLGDYRVRSAGWSSVQVGTARADGPTLRAPEGPIAAVWVGLFCTTMLNHYPWGLSVNIVEPLGPGRTRIRYRRWVRDAALLEKGAGGALVQVEAEDGAIVARVQRGVRSRLARPGRYAPNWEDGLGHFHQRLAELLASPGKDGGFGGT